MTRRLRSDDGANAVEFALVLPVLVMLIFGAITAGLTLNAKQQLDHAAREGARYAATLGMGSNPCDPPGPPPPRDWHACVRDHVLGTAVGSVNLSDGGGICVAFVPESGTPDMQEFGSAAAAETGSQCTAEAPTLSGDRVQVRVVAPGQVNAVFVRRSFDLAAKSISRYED